MRRLELPGVQSSPLERTEGGKGEKGMDEEVKINVYLSLLCHSKSDEYMTT